jgi:peptidoglycan/LPS O-acetylase OafA/YrhL
VLVWRSYLYLGRDVGTAWVYNAFDTRFDNLAIGCMLAILVRRETFSARAETLARAQWLPLLTLVALWLSRTRISNAYHYSVGFTVDAVLVAVFIAQILQLNGTLLWRWLEHPVVKYLGLISYPLYLYHVWGLAVPHHLGPLSLPTQFAIGVLASVAVATGSYFVVERPFLALKRRFEVTSSRSR